MTPFELVNKMIDRLIESVVMCNQSQATISILLKIVKELMGLQTDADKLEQLKTRVGDAQKHYQSMVIFSKELHDQILLIKKSL